MATATGKSIGFMYMAKRPCGRVSAAVWDDPGEEMDTGRSVARWIARGDSVERIERFEGQPTPEMICSADCRECLQAPEE